MDPNIAATAEDEVPCDYEDMACDVEISPEVAALLTASETGQIESIRQLLAQGVNVNSKGEEGETPLCTACLQGQLGVVRVLLASGADPRIADEDGTTPLHNAASGGDGHSVPAVMYTAITEQLITAGADVNAADLDMETPLHIAANALVPNQGLLLIVSLYDHSTDLILRLLNSGARRDLVNKNNQTPQALAEDPAIASMLAFSPGV